jgi:hypothetical protein
MRVIALEEHYATQRFRDGPGRRFRDGLASAGARFPGGGGRLREQLGDIDDGRVSERRSRRGRCVVHRDGPARLDGEARPRGGDEQFERRFARGGRPDAPIAGIAM